MRNLYILIGKILKMLPETEKNFIRDLNHYRNKCMYAAPEMMFELWQCVNNVVQIYAVNIKNKEEYHYQIISEWCQGNIDEIKKSFEDRV